MNINKNSSEIETYFAAHVADKLSDCHVTLHVNFNVCKARKFGATIIAFVPFDACMRNHVLGELQKNLIFRWIFQNFYG